MKVCPKCGFEYDNDRKQCLRCGILLIEVEKDNHVGEYPSFYYSDTGYCEIAPFWLAAVYSKNTFLDSLLSDYGYSTPTAALSWDINQFCPFVFEYIDSDKEKKEQVNGYHESLINNLTKATSGINERINNRMHLLDERSQEFKVLKALSIYFKGINLIANRCYGGLWESALSDIDFTIKELKNNWQDSDPYFDIEVEGLSQLKNSISKAIENRERSKREKEELGRIKEERWKEWKRSLERARKQRNYIVNGVTIFSALIFIIGFLNAAISKGVDIGSVLLALFLGGGFTIIFRWLIGIICEELNL